VTELIKDHIPHFLGEDGSVQRKEMDRQPRANTASKGKGSARLTRKVERIEELISVEGVWSAHPVEAVSSSFTTAVPGIDEYIVKTAVAGVTGLARRKVGSMVGVFTGRRLERNQHTHQK